MADDLDKYLSDDWKADAGDESGEVDQAQAVEKTEADPNDEKLSIEEKLAKFELPKEGEKPKDDKKAASFLDLANGLGITRKGLPIEFKDENEVKERLSKDYDYTQKTQELADERKKFTDEIKTEREAFTKQQTEFKEYEKKVHNDLLSHQVLFRVLKGLEKDEPDLIALVEEAYEKELNAYSTAMNNPVVNELKEQLKGVTSKLEEERLSKEKQTNDKFVKDWETGLSEAQKDFGSKLKLLGVTPKWDKVQEYWKDHVSDKLTVKQAMFAVHGEELDKAFESQKKLLTTKAKSAIRTGGAEAVQDTKGEKAEEEKPESYLDAAWRLAKNLKSA